MPVLVDDLNGFGRISGGNGVSDRIFKKLVLFKPITRPGMKSGNIFGTLMPIQLVLQKLLKQVMITEPSAGCIQRNNEEVHFDQPVDEFPAVDL